MLAIDERNMWREQMQRGEIPQQVRGIIEMYKKQREDPCWRATRYVECLGEAALLFLEQLDNLNSDSYIIPRK